MSKITTILILVLVIGLFVWAMVRDSKQPVSPLSQDTPVNQVQDQKTPAQKGDMIVVTSPLPEATISVSPLTIKGRARGNWFFEATAPVNIVNWDGLIIGEGYIQVDEGNDWMTTEYVPFTGTITYDASQLGPYKYGWIILKKHNASGEPQFDDALEFKINFP